MAAVFPVYSESKRDADFDSVQEHLPSSLENDTAPVIVLDFAYMIFLYERELDMLEEMKHTIEKRGKEFVFINCDRELTSILNNRPPLLCLVRKIREE